MRACALALMAALVLGTGAGWETVPAAAQGTAADKSTAAKLGEKYFRVEFEAGRTKGGRTLLTGYVYNDHGLAAARVRLLVDSLDAAGRVTATTVGYVDSLVPLKGRTYFEVPVDKPGVSYRVSVPYFDWIEGRGPRDRF
ncbi:MAG: hypothetical protein HYV93_25280 [Candidatus Rokubacteria bacterium]|nr:hypothetical protein [Candidatus Rokubacteria bacterium]